MMFHFFLSLSPSTLQQRIESEGVGLSRSFLSLFFGSLIPVSDAQEISDVLQKIILGTAKRGKER